MVIEMMVLRPGIAVIPRTGFSECVNEKFASKHGIAGFAYRLLDVQLLEFIQELWNDVVARIETH